ncbi:hypothetical protein GBA52_025692 [Prunus armeniaca]|nr:hypothetical protein GBA52_025692 [Prunus armeniaca]
MSYAVMSSSENYNSGDVLKLDQQYKKDEKEATGMLLAVKVGKIKIDATISIQKILIEIKVEKLP